MPEYFYFLVPAHLCAFARDNTDYRVGTETHTVNQHTGRIVEIPARHTDVVRETRKYFLELVSTSPMGFRPDPLDDLIYQMSTRFDVLREFHAG